MQRPGVAEATETPAWGHGEEGTGHRCMELGTQKKRVEQGKGNARYEVMANDHSQKWMELGSFQKRRVCGEK